MLQVRIKRGANARTTAVQENPLVAFTQPEQPADVFAGQILDIPQGDDFALSRR